MSSRPFPSVAAAKLCALKLGALALLVAQLALLPGCAGPAASHATRNTLAPSAAAEPPDTAAPTATAARFEALVREWIDARAQLDPEWGSSVGLHAGAHRLTRPDSATWSALHALDRRTLAALRRPLALARAGALPAELETDVRLFAAQLRSSLHEAERHDIRRTRPDLALSGISSIHLQLVRDYAPLPQRVADAISRLEEFPAVLVLARGQLSRPPRLWTEMAVENSDGALAFLGALPALTAEATAADPALAARQERAVQHARASLQVWRDWLVSDLLADSTGRFAAGRKVFDWRLRHLFFSELDADSLLALGERDFRETLAKLEETAAAIDPARDWRAHLDEILAQSPPVERLLSVYREEADRARAFLQEHDLVTLPDSKLQILETPEFLRSTVPFAAYSSPAPLDESRLGTFYVTPVAAAHVTADIPGTTWHEAWPGHHLQLVLAKQNPSLVRRLNDSPLLSEGWGLYCEELAHETGYFRDPRERLMQLNWRLQRAARVILDTRLHAFGMQPAEAVRFLMEEVGLGRAAAEASVNAYTLSPGYFSSYLLGMLQITELRESLRERLGPRFSLREFHDRLLAGGNVPPELLGREIAAQWR